MKFWELAVHLMGAASIVTMSGCATTFVRSKSTADPQHVYPATALDAQFFWKSGINGEPLFVTADPNARNGPGVRLAYGVGAFVVLPFSIALDTILLPIDLFRPKARTRSGDDSEQNSACDKGL